MNPQVDVPAMGSLYNQGTWSSELGSPLHEHSPLGSVHSPVGSAHSPVLSHNCSPMPTMQGCCSPISPIMQPAHSPIMHGSPGSDMIDLNCVKQERLHDELRYSGDSCCESLSSLLRSNELIAAQNMAMIPSHMGPPHPREILDGKFTMHFLVYYATVQLLGQDNIHFRSEPPMKCKTSQKSQQTQDLISCVH